jgi:hypothetical protein
MTDAKAWRDNGSVCSKRFLKDTTLLRSSHQKSQISVPRLFGHPRNLDVQNLGRRDSSAASGGLSTLQLVQRPVELLLYGGLASGELRGYALLT